jgi:CubicO group peptidase (beta-lactamase class C family)
VGEGSSCHQFLVLFVTERPDKKQLNGPRSSVRVGLRSFKRRQPGESAPKCEHPPLAVSSSPMTVPQDMITDVPECYSEGASPLMVGVNFQHPESAAEDAVGGVDIDPDHLSEMLVVLAHRYRVPGAQLAIYHAGETVAVEVGELECGTQSPVTRDAAFPIGSISKTFTATLAMILVADGDLGLDDPLGEHLPELGDPIAQLTLRQLLSHTSGLADSDSGAVSSTTVSMLRYVLHHCDRHNPVLPPGAGFSYSNIGYVLVGHLIETITGMSWWDAMESILLLPLGIEPTFIGATGHRPLGRPLATGHSVNMANGRTRPVTQSLLLAEAPAGGLAVSAMDLVNLGLTQLDGCGTALLPPSYAEQMRQAVPGAELFGAVDGWGLGLAVFRNEDAIWVGHDGNASGTACYLRVEPVNGSVVAFTSNANIGIDMWQELTAELRKMSLPIQSYSTVEALSQPAAAPPGCVGSYRNGDTEYSVTLQGNGNHCLEVDGEAVAWLSFHEDFTFSQRDVTSGEWMGDGLFLWNPVTGYPDGILVNGRVGRRQWDTRENRPGLIAAQVASV